MILSYFDETGDDGFHNSPSLVFVLTSACIHHGKWKENYKKVYDFRKYLNAEYKFPSKLEIHTRSLLTNKKPYRGINLDNSIRITILKEFSECISKLDIKVNNIIIDKSKIRSSNYNILDKSLTYNVQRIENMIQKNEFDNFIIISDEGRVGPMAKTVRKIQKYNPIRSHFGGMYQNTIKLIIEDVLSKDSKTSCFIQIADFISFFVYLFLVPEAKWHSRIKIDKQYVREILEKIKPILNIKASKNSPFGFVIYPT